MLVFNCSKAAAEFFSTTKKGKKVTCIEPAPEKTISEVSAKTEFDNDEPHWQWLVHAIKVKRKNVLIVIDCKTRFSMTLTGLKKGDEYAFLNMFEHHLNLNIYPLLEIVSKDSDEINETIERYGEQHTSCAFYQRSDRSVQATINDIAWHFEHQAYECGYVAEDFALIKFDGFVNKMLRKNKGSNDYFSPHHQFLQTWLSGYSEESPQQIEEKITTLKDLEREWFNQEYDYLASLETTNPNDNAQVPVTNTSATSKNSNVIELDLFRKKR